MPGYPAPMGTGAWIVTVVTVAAVVAVVAWFSATRHHPERHREPPRPADATGRGTLPGRVVERPAGPDAESMSPEQIGGDAGGRPA